MISTKYQELREYIDLKVGDGAQRKKVASIAAGVAASRMLPIPSSPVDHAESYYSTKVAMSAQELIGHFHEHNLLLDLDLAFEVCRSYWLVRYGCAHPNVDLPMIASGNHCFIAKVTNTARYLNPEVHDFCEQWSDLMITVINRVTMALKDHLENNG